MQQLHGGIQNLSREPNFAYEYDPNGLPWTSITAAHNGCPVEYLREGRFRFINDGTGLKEYWYKGGIGIVNLVRRYENLDSAEEYIQQMETLLADTTTAAAIATGQYDDKGSYNAATNTPALTANAASGQSSAKRQAYFVDVPGIVAFAGENFDAGITLNAGDYLYQNAEGKWSRKPFDLLPVMGAYDSRLPTNGVVTGSAANQGTYDVTERSVSVPNTGQGTNTTLLEEIFFTDFPEFSQGATIEFCFIIREGTPGIFTTAAATWIPGVGIVQSNGGAYGDGVYTNRSGIIRIGPDEIWITFQYNVPAGITKIKPFFRLFTGTNSTGVTQKFYFKSLQYRILANTSETGKYLLNNNSRMLYAIRQYISSLKTLVTDNTSAITPISSGLETANADILALKATAANMEIILPTGLTRVATSVSNGAIIGTADATANTISFANNNAPGTANLLEPIIIANNPNWKVGTKLKVTYQLIESPAGLFSQDYETIPGVKWCKPNVQINVQRNGGPLGDQGTTTQFAFDRISANEVRCYVEYTIQTGDTTISPFFRFNSDVNKTGATVSVKWAPTQITILKSSLTFNAISEFFRLLVNRLTNVEQIVTKTTVYIKVMPSGGDFATVTAALASITDASSFKKYVILLYPGIYTDYGWVAQQHVSVIGTDPRTCIYNMYIPDDASDAEMKVSNFWLSGNNTIANIAFNGWNCQYNMHDDQPGSEDVTNHIINCHFTWKGNQGAIDWRNSPANTKGYLASTVYAFSRPIGKGTRSGAVTYWTDCKFEGKNNVFYVHNQLNFKQGSKDIMVSGNYLITRDNFEVTILLQSYGSGTRCVFDGSGMQTSPGIVYHIGGSGANWFSNLPENQTSSHCEFDVTLPKNSGWRDVSEGLGLRIAHRSTTNPVTLPASTSKVRISGTAAPYIFGTVIERDLGFGMFGYAYGSFDIGSGSNNGNNTLGKRLGNCATTPKSLTVTINDVPYVIDFTTNLTSIANSTIINSINAVLGANGIASEYQVAQNEYYPSIDDRAYIGKNTGTITIPRFAPVKLGSSLNSFVGMTSADSPSLFAGIVLEPVLPDAFGRIGTELILDRYQMPGLAGSGSGGYGSNISVGPTVGSYVLNNTCVIGRGANSEFGFFKANQNLFPLPALP